MTEVMGTQSTNAYDDRHCFGTSRTGVSSATLTVTSIPRKAFTEPVAPSTALRMISTVVVTVATESRVNLDSEVLRGLPQIVARIFEARRDFLS